MKLARSIRWCVVALLPTILLVAFLVGVEARVPQMIEPGAVILSEVAWGGTAAGSADEWLELYNTTAAAINLNGWSLTDSSGDLNHTLNGTIPAHGFYLLERTDDSTVSDIPADEIYTGGLSNTGETLTLRDSGSTVIDTANGDGGVWPAGSGSPGYFSMERSGRALPDLDGNWVANDGSLRRNGLDANGNPLNGTPKQDNALWPPLDEPDLAVSKAAPALATAGELIPYELHLANLGGIPAGGVRLTDTLPAGLVYVSDDSGLPVNQNPPYLVWEVGSLGAGAALDFTLTATIGSGVTGLITNSLSAGTTTPESNLGNNLAQAATQVVPAVTGVVMNEIHADPDGTAGDANGDGVVDSADDEFVEFVNVSGAALDLSGWQLADDLSTRHVFPAHTVLPDGCGLVVFGGGQPVGGLFGNSGVQVASAGSLSLNNSGDTVVLRNLAGSDVVAYTYGAEGGDNQSLTRVPDIVGPDPLLKHSTASGAGGALYSPGKRLDGTLLAADCSLPSTTLSIGQIQGTGITTTWRDERVTTSGVVAGLFEGNLPGGDEFNGVFIQDPAGDGNPASSDGLYVNLGPAGVGLLPGDAVQVTGIVQEFDEYEQAGCLGPECMTQLAVVDLNSLLLVGSGSVAPTLLDPPGDPAAAQAYFESREGMLVSLPVTGTVVGPTSFGTVTVIPGDEGVTRVFRNTPYEGMPFGVRHYERFGEIGGVDPPNLLTGSVIEPAAGPLAFSYGSYLLTTQAGMPWTVITAAPLPAEEPTWPAPSGSAFTVATFNTENFDNPAEPKMDKLVRTIINMNGPTFLALEEVDVAAIMGTLLARLNNAGYAYGYANSAPDAGGHGIALLWRADRVTQVSWSIDYQGCSPVGSTSSTSDPLWEYCRSLGEYPLFSRRPVVLTGTVALGDQSRPVVVVANHFKSKLGGAPSDQRRLEQGQFVAALVGSLIAHGSPRVVVMGDLNDYEDSPPLQALYAGGHLTSTWYTLPAEARYSYIFRGVSQVLDHVLVSPALAGWLQAFAPLHSNADFPYLPYTYQSSNVWHASDHDPVIGTFVYPAGEYGVYLPVLFRP